MPHLSLKPTHKPIKAYYAALKDYEQLGVKHETAVKTAFQDLLVSCGRQFSWTLVPEWPFKRPKKQPLRIDGALVDSYNLARAYWEAKDSQDDLRKEVQKKFKTGYPKDNIIFQQPDRAILYQDGRLVMDEDITDPQRLVDIIRQFFDYRPPAIDQWERAVEEFGERVKDHGNALLKLIQEQGKTNKRFIDAFDEFLTLCRQSINPNLSQQAVEEMLIQHLLTERVFRSVFNNPDFAQRNIIAVEIEKVINALTSKSFSRSHFLSSLDRFYGAIEETAATIDDFSQKQDFLNTIYERFFQGFSVKVADTHGIVYTPQPIVNFMVKSVEEILQREFGKSLVDKGVHILDPFVGTGNFIIRIMREIVEIQKSALPYKYANELHCNEVMLLPYYIASMNIEHEYFEQTEQYEPFNGICLVDTFELAESKQKQLSLFAAENTARIERQKHSSIFVIIGNPPYNAVQVNENDNNKNRKYEIMDQLIAETYSRDSVSTNVNRLGDPYVKAIRWASDRIEKKGIVALVTNNSFISKNSFDGMRKHLQEDFDSIYLLDLGGNVKENPQISGTTHNVFGVQVGISINVFVKRDDLPEAEKTTKIFYAGLEKFMTKEEKYSFLENKSKVGRISWERIKPDKKSAWLNEGIRSDFKGFLLLGSKATGNHKLANPKTLFRTYGMGVNTARNAWAYNFDEKQLSANIKETTDFYNQQIFRWQSKVDRSLKADDFVDYDDSKISWSRDLKADLKRGKFAEFNQEKIRIALFRPFTKTFLFLDRVLNEEVYIFPSIFPDAESESQNLVICINTRSEKPFTCLASKHISDLIVTGGFGSPTQCFPFYTYDEDGTSRKENITDWALEQFQAHYEDPTITKWEIFHYTYAVLHHPNYRTRYAANLKRELPRIPYAPEFRPFANAGQRLADIHVHYEDQAEYPLKHLEDKDLPIDWRVEKMRLSKDKTQLKYNDFLTLTGIPPEVFEYRLGNRSALDWVIDQYRIKTDKRSGITNDPNRLDDEEYIVRLIKKVITVSLETVKIVNALPDLGLPTD